MGWDAEDLQGILLADENEQQVTARDSVFFNRAVLTTWPLFSLFLLTQPWMSNWVNDMWFNYSAGYDVYADDGSLQGVYYRQGVCITPAAQMHCTDGQNFTELALAHRGVAYGCGCGQGVYGEGLCPMTMYGYTLSDFVNTAPALGAMLGLGFFPLIGTWQNTMAINKHARPTRFWEALHFYTMYFFQISYILWGMASDCIFPTAHAVLTVAFLSGFLAHWVVSAIICIASEGEKALEARVVTWVALSAVIVMGLGGIPRVFLVMNGFVGPVFPNWNRGLGSYAFWFAEAAGLSLTFGAYPLVLIAYNSPLNKKPLPKEFRLFYDAPVR